MIPAAERADGPVLGDAADADPGVQRYRAFCAPPDWRRVPERAPHRAWPGSPPPPKTADAKALLVKPCEGQRFGTDSRALLREHPLLVVEPGLRPGPDPAGRSGFGVARPGPGDRWPRPRQQTRAPAVPGALLAGTVRAPAAAIPGLGTPVAGDVKHTCAWVRENAPKAAIPRRFDPARHPRGDPACRLGGKRRSARAGRRGRRGVEKESLWGDGTGIVSATDPASGDVVPAGVALPFNHQDVGWCHPVDDRAVAALGCRPTDRAAAAAALPGNRRRPPPPRAAAGHPICARGRALVATSRFAHADGFRAQRSRCPLRLPPPTGEACDHARFAKGGRTTYTNREPGGRMRAEWDRRSEPYRAIYRQRTSAERINSQAKALGIERPMVRRAAAVHRLNALTSIVIDVRALHRVRTLNTLAQPPPPTLC